MICLLDTGEEEAEFEKWKQNMARASAAERVSEVAAMAAAHKSKSKTPWKPSMERAIPTTNPRGFRGRQHGSSSALHLMHSLSPQSYDISEEGWLPR